MVLMGFVTNDIYHGIQKDSVLFLIHQSPSLTALGVGREVDKIARALQRQLQSDLWVSIEPRIFLSGNGGKIKEYNLQGKK